MTDDLVLLVDEDLADELAVELAVVPGLHVQVGIRDEAEHSRVNSAGEKEDPLYSIVFSNMETLIVTGASTATALLTFAQAVLGFLRDRRKEHASDPVTSQPSIVVNNQFIVTADLKDGERMLSTYLQENEVRQIVINTEAAHGELPRGWCGFGGKLAPPPVVLREAVPIR